MVNEKFPTRSIALLMHFGLHIHDQTNFICVYRMPQWKVSCLHTIVPHHGTNRPSAERYSRSLFIARVCATRL